jgi:endoglucanase
MVRRFRTRPWLVLVSALLAVATVGYPSLVGAKVKDGSGLYVPDPNPGAHDQIVGLHTKGQHADADLIENLIETPQAVWFTKGTPQEVGQSVAATVKRAKHALPVLVAYNIPGRDCANLSAGGATTTAEYVAWIDAFAAGIGNADAIVILEPDGLGLLPSNCGAGFPFTDTERFIELNHAVDALAALPNARVYLDGTHSAWLNVGDITSRLVQAGVSRADGFYLNASNYQFSANLVQYGTWISSCIALGPGADCPNQYWNGGPLPSLLAQLYGEWNGVALSNFGEWSDTTSVQDLNTSAINLRYANALGTTVPTTHFVIDTSRNGAGPWAPPAYPDSQDWCNPPDRGTGLRPTLDSGVPLLDAYLWIKIPGESDGSCARGLGPAGTTVDPEWEVIDPAAGLWFPEMALELARNSVPGP